MPPLQLGQIDDSAQHSDSRDLLYWVEQKPGAVSAVDRNQLVGKIAPDLAHSLNNSFNAMLLRLNLLREDTSDRLALSHVDALNRLLNDTAEKIAALQQFVTQKNPELETVNLRQLIETVLARALADARARGIEVALQLDFPSTSPDILGQPAPLGEVLLGLVHYVLLRADRARPAFSLRAAATPEAALLAFGSSELMLNLRDGERRLDPFEALRQGPERVGLVAAQSLIRQYGGAFAMAESGTKVAFLLEFQLARPNNR